MAFFLTFVEQLQVTVNENLTILPEHEQCQTTWNTMTRLRQSSSCNIPFKTPLWSYFKASISLIQNTVSLILRKKMSKFVMLCFCRWLRWNALQNWMYSAQMVLQPLILLGILHPSLQKRGEWLVVQDQWVNHVLILKTSQSINQGRKKKRKKENSW